MCDPMTIGGIALSALGSGVSAMQQQKLAEQGAAARRAAAEAEIVRQRRFRDEAQPMVTSVAKQTGAEQTLADLLGAQEKRTGALASAVTDDSYAPAPASGVQANEEVIRQVSNAAGKARANAGLAGALQGWGDVGVNQGLALGDANRNLASVSDLAGGSIRLLPMEQDVAQYNATRKGPGMLGDLLGLAGKGVALAGMTGFKPWANSPKLGMYSGGTATNPLTGLRVGGV